MRCGRPANVDVILVGLHQVGIVGLRDALKEVERSGLTTREDVVEWLTGRLAGDNYVPSSQLEPYRQALWREFLRSKGEEIRDLYSEIEAKVRGVSGPERDRFVEVLCSVFGEFELKPVVQYVDPIEKGSPPELLIDEETVVRGFPPRDLVKAAIRRRISEW